MHTVTNFARHLLRFQPNKDASRLCLYHFLVHHCAPDTPLSAPVLNHFVRRALSHPYWREKRQVLSDELQYSLQHFLEAYQGDLDFKSVMLPDRHQVIELEKDIDHLRMVESFLSGVYSEKIKYRIFPMEEDLVTVAMLESGEVELRYFNRLALIENGSLTPLCADFKLTYEANLDLKAGCNHHWPIDSSVTARFCIEGDGYRGRLVRGYTFQNYQILEGGNGEKYPELFYRIKRVERLFIDKDSDNTYKELVRVLQRAVELLDMGHPEAESLAKTTLERARVAFTQVYTDDNTVRLLLQKLELSFQKTLRKPLPQNIL